MTQSQKKSEPKVDKEIEASFPASDPPSYMGSSVAGGPKDHAPQEENGSAPPVEKERISVNLNTASAEELGALPALGPELVRALIGARPFKSWEDLKQLSDFDGEAIAALKKGGAFIGW